MPASPSPSHTSATTTQGLVPGRPTMQRVWNRVTSFLSPHSKYRAMAAEWEREREVEKAENEAHQRISKQLDHFHWITGTLPIVVQTVRAGCIDPE